MFSGARKVAERVYRDGKGVMYAMRLTFEVSDDSVPDTIMVQVLYTDTALEEITNPNVSTIERRLRARRIAAPFVEARHAEWMRRVADSVQEAIFREA